MGYAFIGVGQCGCGILDSIFQDKSMFRIGTPIAINSATNDLLTLKWVKREHWLGISRSKGFVNGNARNFSHYIVGGYGKNRAKSEEDTMRHYDDLVENLRERLEVVSPQGEELAVPFACIIYGTGGGTGSGTGPIVAKALKDLDVPVVAIVVLPAIPEGGLTSKNSVESMNALIDNVDSVILVDNQRLAYSGNMESLYKRYNDYIARSIQDIVVGTVLEKIDPSEFEGNPPVIDLKDMITATSFIFEHKNMPGFACLGRASERTRGLFHYIFPFGGYKEIDVISMIYRAFMKLSVEGIAVEEAEKNLALLRLPTAYLSKPGKVNTTMVKKIMEERTRLNEAHFGVALTKKNVASSTVLLTYRPNQIARLKDLDQSAVQYADISLKVLEEYEEYLPTKSPAE